MWSTRSLPGFGFTPVWFFFCSYTARGCCTAFPGYVTYLCFATGWARGCVSWSLFSALRAGSGDNCGAAASVKSVTVLPAGFGVAAGLQQGDWWGQPFVASSLTPSFPPQAGFSAVTSHPPPLSGRGVAQTSQTGSMHGDAALAQRVAYSGPALALPTATFHSASQQGSVLATHPPPSSGQVSGGGQQAGVDHAVLSHTGQWDQQSFQQAYSPVSPPSCRDTVVGGGGDSDSAEEEEECVALPASFKRAMQKAAEVAVKYFP